MTFDNNQIQTRDKWYFLFQPLYLKLDVNFPTPQAPLPPPTLWCQRFFGSEIHFLEGGGEGKHNLSLYYLESWAKTESEVKRIGS